MNRVRFGIGVVVALIGLVWLLQGLDVGLMSSSPMTGETTWIVVGALTVVVGLALIWSARTSHRNDS